ncbi:amino acid racemase [Patescibacteria group bacterium]|nr:amino acid racemase [Patescibacteria group bacterium]MBU4367567.1 amino acid racemase [Patescibacteria group bacterium]MBU4461608.1 amino acid racemase [Patescibacteria group bacterium]MCG2699505.1 amino acid racemase [Candidatus Parcubacteria bacterium]
MKTIGILGGLGPETTSKIYHSIINSFRKNKGGSYPSILIYNLPFPFIIENEAIVKGINSHKMLPYLIKGAKILEKSGASFGILPCNTLHKYINEIRESVKIPFLSILDETISRLKLMKIKTIGVLATETTIRDRLYDNVLKKRGIDVLYPTKIEQNNVNKIIVEILNSKQNKTQEKKIKAICSSLYKRGAKAILLACTDLQIITSNIHIPVPLIDSTEIIIQASVRELTSK